MLEPIFGPIKASFFIAHWIRSFTFMAFAVNLSRRSPQLSAFLLRRCPGRPLSLPASRSSPRILFSSHHIHSSTFSFLHVSPFSSLYSAASDFETDSDEPSEPVDESDFVGFVQLLTQAKSLSSSRKEARAFLAAASGVVPTRGLLCKALWELRDDCELALLAFRWAEECVGDCRWAWHLMIWIMGRQRRFDLAWYLVRKMHRQSVLTQRAMVIMMERCDLHTHLPFVYPVSKCYALCLPDECKFLQTR